MDQTVKVEGLIAEELDDNTVPSEREDISEERQRMRDLVHFLGSAPPGNVYIRGRVASCLCLATFLVLLFSYACFY